MEVRELLEKLEVDALTVYFQPIFSIGGRKILGLEALLRGKKGESLVSPLVLFELAEKKGLRVELDRVARKLAFETFKKFYYEKNQKESPILFFNFDASILERDEKAEWFIHRLAIEHDVKPNEIVIEIIETEVKDLEKLKKFVENYKNLGYLIALDDVGVEHSNINRILELKPDFIKIDRTLIRDIHRSEYKSKVIKSLVESSKEIGCFTLVEGIESEFELFKTLELGVNFHQGYFLETPKPLEAIKSKDYNKEYFLLLERLGRKFLSYCEKRKKRKEKFWEKCKKIVKEIVNELETLSYSDFEEVLIPNLKKNLLIHSIYIITLENQLLTPILLPFRMMPYCPCEKLARLILKKGDYIPHCNFLSLLIQNQYKIFVSEPYLHSFTKKLVCTILHVFKPRARNLLSNYMLKNEEKPCILCVDFLFPEEL